MGVPQRPLPEQVQATLRPSLRDDATTDDFERFASFSRIYFERNSASLTEEARKTLDAQAAWLREHPDVRASLQGHADALGTREHQITLGERRATAMKFYLLARGIDPHRLTVTSFGKQRTAVLALDEASQKSNRRGETVLIGTPGASEH
ncbi:MAG: OmpA family protein [Sphingobium limneticum]